MDENTKTYDHKHFNIIYRLDFNGFYTDRLEAMSAERAMKDTSMMSEGSSMATLCPPSPGTSASSLPMSFTAQRPDAARFVPGVKGRKGSGS